MRLKVLVALLVAVAAWRLGSPGAPLIAAEKAAALEHTIEGHGGLH